MLDPSTFFRAFGVAVPEDAAVVLPVVLCELIVLTVAAEPDLLPRPGRASIVDAPTILEIRL